MSTKTNTVYNWIAWPFPAKVNKNTLIKASKSSLEEDITKISQGRAILSPKEKSINK